MIDQARIVDEAPTMASIFGFEMEDIDGKCLDTLLKKPDKAEGIRQADKPPVFNHKRKATLIYICKGDMTYARCS
ncbi:MAG: hypothetical protein ACLUI3_03845 [Christensenellales bacterium]